MCNNNYLKISCETEIIHVTELPFGRQRMMNTCISEKLPEKFVFVFLESGNTATFSFQH